MLLTMEKQTREDSSMLNDEMTRQMCSDKAGQTLVQRSTSRLGETVIARAANSESLINY